MRMPYAIVLPGCRLHCVTVSTPSLKGVRVWLKPCQLNIMSSSSMLFVTVTCSQSPSLSTSVGPGTSPLIAKRTLLTAGSSGEATTLCVTDQTKLLTGPAPPDTPSTYGHLHVEALDQPVVARSIRLHWRSGCPVEQFAVWTTGCAPAKGASPPTMIAAVWSTKGLGTMKLAAPGGGRLQFC